MELYDAIKQYIGRDYDPLTECVLEDDGLEIMIKRWSIPEKPRPTMEELEKIRAEYGATNDKLLKAVRLREVRDDIIRVSIWIKQRHECEELGAKMAIARGITPKPITLTDDQMWTWLNYWDFLRTLPETVDLDELTIGEITPDNKLLFGEFPTSNELTKITI